MIECPHVVRSKCSLCFLILVKRVCSKDGQILCAPIPDSALPELEVSRVKFLLFLVECGVFLFSEWALDISSNVEQL